MPVEIKIKKCSTCVKFGYWKPVHGGEQPVCKYGDNYDFKQKRYNDNHAEVCKWYVESLWNH
jgi:hypothetical protein